MELFLYLIVLSVGVVVGIIAGNLMGKAETNSFRAVAEDRALQIQSLTAGLAQKEGEIRNLTAQLNATHGGYQAINSMAPHAVSQAIEKMQPFSAKIEEFTNQNNDQIRQLRSIAQSMQQEVLEFRKLDAQLKAPKGAGDWGEMQLRTIVELAGMVEHCDFEVQISGTIGDRAYRPDMVIHLPHGRDIYVDAKYQQLGADDKGRETVVKLRKRLTDLSRKSYEEGNAKSPDFVVAFVPESTFFAAVQAESKLLDEFAPKNVLLASPTTLIALLKSAAFGWRQYESATNATEIAQLGTQLYKDLAGFAGEMQAVGGYLDNSVKAFNKAKHAWTGIQPTAQRLQQFAGGNKGDLPAPKTITRTADSFRSDDLIHYAAATDRKD